MSQKHYEVEVKCLLGGKVQAQLLLEKLKGLGSLKLIGKSKQLNHYFVSGNLQGLLIALRPLFSDKDSAQFQEVITKGKNHSLRTRLNDRVLSLVLKANRSEAEGMHESIKLEFEKIIKNLTQEELDRLILESGFGYQSKWSRERTEYRYKDFNFCFDKNAGYGYLIEVEKIVESLGEVEAAHKEILNELKKLGLQELPKERLDRMFKFYNDHWQDYYQTDNVFTVL